MDQKGRSSASSLPENDGAGGGGGTSPGIPWAGAFSISFSAFQPRILVYHRPLYSRLSMSKLKVTVSPTLRGYWSARSPKKSKCTFRGYVSMVSSTYSRFFHWFPAFDVPEVSGKARMILPFISIVVDVKI